MVVTTYVSVRIPLLGKDLINYVVAAKRSGELVFENLLFPVLQILGLTGVLGVFSFIQRYANAYFSQKVIYDVRNDVFGSLQKQSFAFYDKAKTGQLMSRTTTDVDRMRRFLGWELTSIVSSVLLLGGVLMAMIVMDWELTLLSFAVTPFMFIVIYRYGTKIRPVVSSAREHYGTLTSILHENLAGIRVVRAFAREEFEKKKFHTPNRKFFETTLISVKIRAFYFPLLGFLTGLGTIIILWYGGLDVMRGRLDLGNLFAFNSFLLMLLWPMARLGWAWGSYQRMAAAAERIFEIIDAVPEVKDKPNAIKLPPIKGHVRFHNVSFGYEKDRLILKDVNLEAKPGETIALLGPTGSGKTTIIRLLPRFYDVTSGEITLDGYDIRDLKLRSLRKRIGIVAQETFLFAMTIKENIAYGKPNASMEAIIQVAKIARAHDFITALPNGYQTRVGERGVTLSGGQQQRIAIARALLMDPKILILDDSTSSVDVDTEYEIQQALRALLKGRTTFVITQRVSTIRNANKIIVLENGKKVEEGPHESLMAKGGAYYRIYQTLYEVQRPVIAPEADPPMHRRCDHERQLRKEDER